MEVAMMDNFLGQEFRPEVWLRPLPGLNACCKEEVCTPPAHQIRSCRRWTPACHGLKPGLGFVPVASRQVYVFDAIFFGQLGAPWGRWDSLSTWWSDFWKYDLKDVLHEHALAQAASEFRENRVAAAGAAEADIQFSFSRGCLVPVRCEV